MSDMEKRVSARLSEALVARVEVYASEQDRSVSSVVRLALERFLGTPPVLEPVPADGTVVEPALSPSEVERLASARVARDAAAAELSAGLQVAQAAKKLAAAVPGVNLGAERVSQKDCVHPKVERQVKSWGTICGVCGKRL